MAEIIYGRLPVLNALKGVRKPKQVYLFKESPDKRIQYACVENHVRYALMERSVLDRMAGTPKHQGAVAEVDDFGYADFSAELSKSLAKPDPLVLMLDGLDDPVNLGSAIRNAAAFGVDFVVIRKDREVGVTPTVVKISTGATETMPICQVTNLAEALETLKSHGFWSVAAAGQGTSYYDEIDYSYPTVLVIGNEGFGISDKILKKADFIAKIPMPGTVSSLNASVASAVFLAAIVEQRRSRKELLGKKSQPKER